MREYSEHIFHTKPDTPDIKKSDTPFDWFRFDDSGKMMTGWQIIDGTYCYFNPNSDGHRGRMYAGETTPDGYYVDGNGRWIP